jgi:hypothetical protein
MRLPGGSIQLQSTNWNGKFKGGRSNYGAHFGKLEEMRRTGGVDHARLRAFEREILSLLRKLDAPPENK